MTLYVLNSPVLTDYGNYTFIGPVSVPQAQDLLLKHEFVSAIGHQATADLLSAILNVAIPHNRVHIKMKPGDQALVFRLLSRMPDGVILDQHTINEQQYELAILTRTLD
ncbi:STIV orfB116 family protein [Alteromonas gilva]|uniref:DUF1874 domain-containing protein n=1 Tax=Alteromonas gilva TaxID=2987522 RepID=A0ABT5L4U9_9ALTE|nr:DUF1874 domain-containing protein [Alteromonas gilva]MDC8832064.1 DUF1874 domain-containing protein [Alteromonas gilva]